MVVLSHVAAHGRKEDPLAEKMIDHVRHAITLGVRRQIEDVDELVQLSQINMQRVCRFNSVLVKYVVTLEEETGLPVPERRLQLREDQTRKAIECRVESYDAAIARN